MSYNDGYLNGAASYVSDAQSNLTLAREALAQAIDEADCITNDGAILATVQDGVLGAIKAAQSYLEDI